jgi:hypothetical protein
MTRLDKKGIAIMQNGGTGCFSLDAEYEVNVFHADKRIQQSFQTFLTSDIFSDK